MYAGKIPFPNHDGTTTQIDNKKFDLSLKFFAVDAPSKKAPNRTRTILISKDGTKFPMMPKEFNELLSRHPQIMTAFLQTTWEFTKRGTQFGLKLSHETASLNKKPDVPGLVARVPPSAPHDNPMAINGQGAVTVMPTLAPDGSPVEPAAKQRKTLFCLCLDSSGSMSSIRRETTVAAVNTVIRSIRTAAKDNNQIAELMLMKFGTGPNDIEEMFGLTPIDDVKTIDVSSYTPKGGTPLFECIGRAIRTMQARPEYQDADVSFFIHAITDGEENQSRAPFTPEQVNKLIAEVQATDRWTFAVQVPKGTEERFIRTFSVPAGNVQGWATNDRGILDASATTSNAMGSFLRSRSIGVRSSKSIYTTDLSAVKLEDLKSKLVDVSSQVKTWKVDKESVIKDFAEEKTKRPYVIGSIWYCLTKKETVQPYKGIMIRVKNSKEFYAGPDARRLIGIDPNDPKDVVVIPGNHSQYEIYTQSTSVNRKLVRGTDVVFMLPNTPVPETWDSAAAKAAADAKAASTAASP
jgi:uncharacterized protein YegL